MNDFPPSFIHASPVLLLAALNSNLCQSQGNKQTKMPCHHVQPELITESRASWKVGKILSNTLSEQSKETLTIKSRDSNVGWNKPSGSSNHECQRFFVQPFISLGSSTHNNGARAGGTDSARAGSGDSSGSSQKSCAEPRRRCQLFHTTKKTTSEHSPDSCCHCDRLDRPNIGHAASLQSRNYRFTFLWVHFHQFIQIIKEQATSRPARHSMPRKTTRLPYTQRPMSNLFLHF